MSAPARPLGIIAALSEEVRHLGHALAVDDKIVRGGYSFRQGRLDDVPVVLVEAGIGKVNTALVATLLFDHFGCRSVLLTGVAGGIDPGLGIGDVVIADRLIQHDYGAVIAGAIKPFRPGVAPIGESRAPLGFDLASDIRLRLQERLDGFTLPPLHAAVTGGAARQPTIRFGTILSGDQFINCETTRKRLFDSFHAQAAEMEGAAVAQVAAQFNVPCVVVRCLSDLAGGESHLDFPAFLAATAESAALVLRRIVPVL